MEEWQERPLLTDRHKKVCLAWAKERKNWTTDNWNKVTGSDESKFNLFRSDGREGVHKEKEGGGGFSTVFTIPSILGVDL